MNGRVPPRYDLVDPATQAGGLQDLSKYLTQVSLEVQERKELVEDWLVENETIRLGTLLLLALGLWLAAQKLWQVWFPPTPNPPSALKQQQYHHHQM